MDNKIYIALDGPRVSQDGVPVAAFITTLKGLQDALRLMVAHLGNYQVKRGKFPKWLQEQSRLSLTATRPGSLVAELALDSPRHSLYLKNGLGMRGLEALRRWDGTENSTLPESVTDRLYAIPPSLPDNLELWFGSSDVARKIQVRRMRRESTTVPPTEEAALLYGWLMEVNWGKRTAALHRYKDRKVKLKFGDSLDEEMRQSANRFVVVKGKGLLSYADHWRSVTVTGIKTARPHYEQFDLASFLNNPNPKVFDPNKMVTASEPFDVNNFNRIIREGRDIENEDHLVW